MENLNHFISTVTLSEGMYQLNLYNVNEKIWVKEIRYPVISLKMFSENSKIFIAIMVKGNIILFYDQNGNLQSTWK